MTAPQLDRIERPERLRCAACSTLLGRTRHPIDVKPVPDFPWHFDYMVSSARCPLCDAENFLTEACVVPDDIGGGRYFMNDYCWEGDGPEYFNACANSVTWELAHHTNIREVSFEPMRGENTPLVRDSAWLDIHYLPPIIAPDFEDAMSRIADVARRIQPAILELRWR